MKKIQMPVFVAALLDAAVMCLFPPWEYQNRRGEVRAVGYGFVAAPPAVPILDNAGGVARYDPATRINTSRLVVQVAAALAFAGAVLVVGKIKAE